MITTRDNHVAQSFKSLKILNKSRNDAFSCKFQLAALFVLESHVAVRVVSNPSRHFYHPTTVPAILFEPYTFQNDHEPLLRVGIPTKSAIT
jgi:hypothetical protein